VLARIIFAPVSATMLGSKPLTVACVPTGMKRGVSNVPWGVVTVPILALQEVDLWWISNCRGFISGAF